MSVAAQPMRSAAAALTEARKMFAAATIAEPPITMERELYEPKPSFNVSVEP